MDKQLILELIGYFASGLVLISFLMSSILKLRLINLTGSFIFAVYAVLIGSYPTAIMNLGVVCINIYYLVRLLRRNNILTILPAEFDSEYFQRFIMFFGRDIQTYFPDFSLQNMKSDVAYFVCCDMVTAGLIIGKDLHNGTLEVELDYTTPQYRDCSVGKYLYQKLADLGYTTLVFHGDNKKHEKYMIKMGFVRQDGHYVKSLKSE